VAASRGTVSQRMSNDSVKFKYYHFEALGSRRQATKKEKEKKTAEIRLAIYSRKTKFGILCLSFRAS